MVSWWQRDPKRWQDDVTQMNLWYPGWRSFDRLPVQFARGSERSTTPKAWDGIIRPFANSKEPRQVLAALAQNKTINVDGGTLDVCAEDFPEPMELYWDDQLLYATYAFLVTYREPPAHPVAMLTHPIIDPACPHVYTNGAACPLYPPDGAWDWKRGDTIARYIDFLSIWAGKYAYWHATKRLDHRGIWLGNEVPHDAEYRQYTDANAQCWCGSGQLFRFCHGRTM